MKIIADVIATVSGPDFNYPLSRLLFAEDGRVAVFVLPGREPSHFFTANPGHRPSIQGTGFTDAGPVSWQRKGSSCSYKLAKCQVNTARLTERWQRYEAEVNA